MVGGEAELDEVDEAGFHSAQGQSATQKTERLPFLTAGALTTVLPFGRPEDCAIQSRRGIRARGRGNGSADGAAAPL